MSSVAETININEQIVKKSEFSYSKFKLTGLFLGPLLFILILLSTPPEGIAADGWKVIAVAALMITWWITEAIPMPVTSLLPILLFPFLNIFNIKVSSAPYANPAVFLYLGGFILAIAIEKWRLHIRIALTVVRITGTNANGIIAGFILATGVLSMWMSNTATVVMMLPISMSVISLLMQDLKNNHGSKQDYENFATAMMLGIAYAASIGGIATLIGTPTNVIFGSFMRETFNYEINFGNWMKIGIPFAMVMLAFNWAILTKICFPNKLGELKGAKELVQRELKALGPMSYGEKAVLVVFVLTALLWSFRYFINEAMPFSLTDESIAILAAITLFVIPVDLKAGQFLLSWKAAEKLPWGILLLFGGGLSLASGFESTGLVDYLGGLIGKVKGSNIVLIIFVVSFIAVFLTEFMSNMALVTILLPVLAAMAIAFGINPLVLAVPVTISASCAFMLPMSTPPNAIVFASGHVKITQMMRAGITLNIVGILFVIYLTYSLLPSVFNFNIHEVPDWALQKIAD